MAVNATKGQLRCPMVWQTVNFGLVLQGKPGASVTNLAAMEFPFDDEAEGRNPTRKGSGRGAGNGIWDSEPG